MRKKLSIAFLISEKNELPAWEAEMIEHLQHDDSVSKIFFILGKSLPVPRQSFVYRLFKKFESWWFKSIPDAFKSIDVREKFSSLPFISLPDMEKEGLTKPDIIYCSCLANPETLSADASVFGTWRIIFGNNKYTGVNPAAFYEVMDDCNEAGSSLVVTLPGQTEPLTVYRGTTAIVPYSVKNTLNCIAWKSSSFFIYRLKEFMQKEPETFFGYYREKYGVAAYKQTNLFPSGIRMTWYWLRNVVRYCVYKLRTAFPEKKFTLLFSFQQAGPVDADLKKLKPLTLPKGFFWADPFVVEKDGQYFIFFEEYSYSAGKAHISVLKISPDGAIENPVIILDKPYHLSYPFVLEHGNSYYMIPESSADKTVSLYRCKEFPYQWEFHKTLMKDIPVIDATVFNHAGKWWMFGCVPGHSFTSTNDQLFLFFSDDLFSDNWTAHPQNPVATEISNCRPAGNIFKSGNTLYRPSQNNASKQYGYGMKINEIITLTETEYREKEIAVVNPEMTGRLSAIHTINVAKNIVVADGIL